MKRVNNHPDKIVEVTINPGLLASAKFLARQRLVFEYPRSGYGQYDEKHLLNLEYGYLGELAFLTYIVKYLNAKYRNIPPIDKFKRLQNEQFSYHFVIGQTDKGFDFQIKDKEIDVKTYGTALLKSKNDIFKYNLLIDQRQAQNHRADIYIQTFIIGHSGPEICVIAGFYEGLPPVNNHFPTPAHAIRVNELFTMEYFLQRYF